MAVLLTVGEKLSTSGALISKIELYKRSDCVQFHKSSRKIASAKSRCPKKTFNRIRNTIHNSIYAPLTLSIFCVESRKFTSSLEIKFISLQQW